MSIGLELKKQYLSYGYQEGVVNKAVSSIITSTNSNTEKLICLTGAAGISTPLTHPYLGPNSWLRIMPERGTKCMVARRGENNEPYISAYLSENAAENLNKATEENRFYYRSLREGEIDVATPGLANLFLARKGNIELRGGTTSMKFHADGGEIQSRAPTFSRQTLGNKRQEVGDEERFGVVQRPGALNKKFPDQPTIRNIITIPPIVGPYFAKEYLRILRSDGPIPGITLIEHKEGDVYDDSGDPQTGATGLLLRSITKYGTTIPGTTTNVEVDVAGSVNVSLPETGTLLASVGTSGSLGSIKLGVGALEAITKISMTYSSPNIVLKSSVATTFKGPLFEAKNSLIKLGSEAIHPGVLGDLLLQYLITHTHSTGVGPSGPPIVLPTTDLLSKIVTLK